MQSFALDPKQFRSATFHVVGTEYLQLEHAYDPDQYWLPFMVGAVFKPATVENKPHYGPGNIERMHQKAQAPYAKCADGSRVLFAFERDQFVLPFSGRMCFSLKQFKRFKQAGYPGWELDRNGHPFTVDYQKSELKAVREWCAINCTGAYFINNGKAIFQVQDDYLFVRLAFQTDKTETC